MFWLVMLFQVTDHPALALLGVAITMAITLVCVLAAIAWIGWPA